MKLNLRIVKDELVPLTVHASITSAITEFPCVYPVPYHEGDHFEAGPLYVADAADLPARPRSSAGATLISIGQPPSAYLEEPFDLAYIDEPIGIAELLGKVSAIFGRYALWGDAMQRAIDEGLPLRQIGELSEPFLGNPLFLQGWGFKCIFHIVGSLDGLSEEKIVYYRKVYGGDFPLQDNTYLPLDGVDELISDAEYIAAAEKREPTIYSGKARINFRCLYYNVEVDDHFIARLWVDEIKHVFNDRDFALIQIVGHYLEKAVRTHDVFDFTRQKDLDFVLVNLLSHRLIDAHKIIDVLRYYHWEMNDSYYCLVLEPRGEMGRETLEGLALQFEPHLTSECYTIFDGRLVFILNLTRTGVTQDKSLEQVTVLFRDNLLAAGVSNVFEDFKDVYYYYLQAKSALITGQIENPTYWYFRYSSYELEDLIARCKDNQIVDSFIPQGLRALMDYDEKNEAQLTDLLRIYLEHNMNIADTTRAGFMHRNTCMYRLNRIREISGMDLEDPDTRLMLLIVYKMLDEATPRDNSLR